MAKQEANWIKARGDMYTVLVKLRQLQEGFEYRRYSPAVKEHLRALEEATREVLECWRKGIPTGLEINVWEQLSLTGWFIDEDGIPRDTATGDDLRE